MDETIEIRHPEEVRAAAIERELIRYEGRQLRAAEAQVLAVSIINIIKHH